MTMTWLEWCDYLTALLDEANTQFGTRITLVRDECVIQFLTTASSPIDPETDDYPDKFDELFTRLETAVEWLDRQSEVQHFLAALGEARSLTTIYREVDFDTSDTHIMVETVELTVEGYGAFDSDIPA